MLAKFKPILHGDRPRPFCIPGFINNPSINPLLKSILDRELDRELDQENDPAAIGSESVMGRERWILSRGEWHGIHWSPMVLKPLLLKPLLLKLMTQ